MDAKVHFNLKKQKTKVSAGRLQSILSALLPFSLSVISSEQECYEHSGIKREKSGGGRHTHDLPSSSCTGSQKMILSASHRHHRRCP